MSLLTACTEASPGVSYFAPASGGGGGGGGSSLQSPATITPAPVGTCSLAIESLDSTQASLIVSSTGGGGDTGTANILLNGGTATVLAVASTGAGGATVNITGGTAGGANLNLNNEAGFASQISIGATANQVTMLGGASTASLSFSTPAVENQLVIDGVGGHVNVTGLKLVDGVTVPGAITGQNYSNAAIGPSGAAVNITVYPLPAVPAGANSIGWWCYAIGTGSTTDLVSAQACVSVMAYWNGTTFAHGGNVVQVLGGQAGWTAGYFSQIFKSTNLQTLNFFFSYTTGYVLSDMVCVLTQMTGPVPGF
jgi:hypothetical protein